MYLKMKSFVYFSITEGHFRSLPQRKTHRESFFMFLFLIKYSEVQVLFLRLHFYLITHLFKMNTQLYFKNMILVTLATHMLRQS